MGKVNNIVKTREKNLPSTRKLSEDFDRVGALGEVYFSEVTGLPVDEKRYAGGDDGVDFTVKGLTIDVKTARKPYNLIVEKGKVKADIYVLAGIAPSGKPYLLGWEYANEILNAPTKDFGYGITNHYIKANNLRSIKELFKIVESPAGP